MKDQDDKTFSDVVLAPEWEAEIARRVEEIVSGKVRGVAAEEVHRRMQNRLSE